MKGDTASETSSTSGISSMSAISDASKVGNESITVRGCVIIIVKTDWLLCNGSCAILILHPKTVFFHFVHNKLSFA